MVRGVADGQEEGAVELHLEGRRLVDPHAHGAQRDAGRGGGFRALLVDSEQGLVQHAVDFQGRRILQDAREFGGLRERAPDADSLQGLFQFHGKEGLQARQSQQSVPWRHGFDERLPCFAGCPPQPVVDAQGRFRQKERHDQAIVPVRQARDLPLVRFGVVKLSAPLHEARGGRGLRRGEKTVVAGLSRIERLMPFPLEIEYGGQHDADLFRRACQDVVDLAARALAHVGIDHGGRFGGRGAVDPGVPEMGAEVFLQDFSRPDPYVERVTEAFARRVVDLVVAVRAREDFVFGLALRAHGDRRERRADVARRDQDVARLPFRSQPSEHGEAEAGIRRRFRRFADEGGGGCPRAFSFFHGGGRLGRAASRHAAQPGNGERASQR